MIDKNKILIVTTVSNENLFDISKSYHPNDIDRAVIKGSNNFFGIKSITFLMRKLKSYKYEWVIMIDEDAFVVNPDELFDLIYYMNKYKFDIAGVRDGGVIKHRIYNPFTMNTSFIIFNYEEIKKKWSFKDVMKSNKILNINRLNLPDKLPYEYNVYSDFEPYYCFFYWLLNNKFTFLYLDSGKLKDDSDEITNVVYNHKGNDIVIHSWFARNYGGDDYHTERIDRVIAKLGCNKVNSRAPVIYWEDKYYQKSSEILRKFRYFIKSRFRIQS